MKQPQRKDCQNFRQHYTFDERMIFRVYCGHCTPPVLRRKCPDGPFAPSCVQSPFVTKEYLSKALLDYMHSLELLPSIVDAE